MGTHGEMERGWGQSRGDGDDSRGDGNKVTVMGWGWGQNILPCHSLDATSSSGGDGTRVSFKLGLLCTSLSFSRSLSLSIPI